MRHDRKDNRMTEHGYQTRTWEELKAETLARAGRGVYPVFAISSDDARAALAMIQDLDPEAWGAAWMDGGGRPLCRARAGSGSERYLRRGAGVPRRLAALHVRPLAGDVLAEEGRELCEGASRVRGLWTAGDASHRAAVDPVRGSRHQALAAKARRRCPAAGDHYLWKDSVAIQARGFLPHGIAAIAVDKPGTADAPVPVRPGSERMISAIIDHVQSRADLDGRRIIVRGQSWGSYWSARAAYAERDRLKGAVFQSGPVHRYFQREWQQEAFKTREFLFDYVPSRLHMLGVASVEEAFAVMPSLSLLDGDLIEQPTPPMLLIGGARDTQVPFSDFVLMLEHGSPKHAWVNPAGQTMGRSLSVKDDDIFHEVVVPWVRHQFGR